MKLSRGIIQVVIANIINLIISIGNGFLLPKFLTVESYATLKTFLLYISYVGILHLGYIDGVYIKYGGRSIKEIEAKVFSHEKKVLVIFQIIISLPVLFIALLLKDTSLLLAASSILPINMVSFFKFVYQATGEFKQYRYITNITSIMIFALNLLFLFVIKTDNALWYISMQVAVSFTIWFFYENKSKAICKAYKVTFEEIYCLIRENVCLGAIIMLGNFMGIWITNIDRWFVKIFHDVAEFAYYSFAVTMLKLINVIVTAFSVTLYHFFCKTTQQEDVAGLRKIVLMVGAIIIAAIFPVEFVIQSYLEKYMDAIPIIRMLFTTQFVLIAVNAIYMNLYKALNLQKKYLVRMIVITVVAFLTNMISGYLWNGNVMAYAVATFITAFIWLVLCQIDLPVYRMRWNEYIYVMAVIAVYIVCANLSIWFGITFYTIWIGAITFLIFPNDIKRFVKIVYEMLDKKE